MPMVGKRGRKFVGGLLGLMVVLSLTACGGGGGKTVLGASTADVTVDQTFRFNPDKVTIHLNKDISFTVLNKDKKVHNITIPGFAVDMDVQPGQRVEVKLPAVASAPRDGFFSFYCKYHQSEGEHGRINVSR